MMALPQPTNENQKPSIIQVKYWEALCHLVKERGEEGMPEGDWPSDLPPSPMTLQTMTAHDLLERRGDRWHLGHGFPFGLKLLEHEARTTPKIVTAIRPAPDLPSYDELAAWDIFCRWLDTQPKRRARLPFAPFPDLPLARLKELRKYRILRHTADCQWALSPKWKEKLLTLWNGSLYAGAERPKAPPTLGAPKSLAAGLDTFYLNWFDHDGLPPHLRMHLDDLQEEARSAGKEVETPWTFDGVPLKMYQYGSSSRQGKGVSWSYILRSPDIALLVHRTPLGGVIAQIRIGSAALWRLTGLGAVEEAERLLFSLWGKTEGHWQVSQAHFCHDVMNTPIDAEQLGRFVSRSHSQAVFDAARRQIATLLGVPSEDDLELGLDWEEVFGVDDPSLDAGLFEDGWEEELDPLSDAVEDRDVTVYRWGQRLSGIAWSPGAAVSFVMYDKVLEMQRHGKRHMEAIWRDAGWDGVAPVTRHEPRLRRDAIRGLRFPGLPPGALDNPRVFIQHLPDLFALIVGRAAECPDAVEAAWLRRVEPQERDTNRSRWPTDAAWRVVQDAHFTPASEEVRQLTREQQVTYDIDKRVQTTYGSLVSFAALRDPDAGQWDISQAIGQVAEALHKEAARPEKDFGTLVRERQRKLGLPVPMQGRVLPFERRRVQEGTDQEPAPDENDDACLLVIEHAWRYVQQAEQELEEAQRRGAPEAIEDRLGAIYTQALAEYARLLESAT